MTDRMQITGKTMNNEDFQLEIPKDIENFTVEMNELRSLDLSALKDWYLDEINWKKPN